MKKYRDLRTRIIVRIINNLNNLNAHVSTCLVRMTCVVWQISLGRGVRFYGKPLLWRSPETSITVEENCRFRSGVNDNKIGINRPCMLSTLRAGAIIHIGKNCGFSGTVIAAAKSVRIGNDVICGANSTITDTDFHFSDPLKRQNKHAPAGPVVIEDNVWLGLNVTVLKGVTIGKGSVVATNSTVVKSIPAGVLVAGVPAKIIKNL